MTCMPQACYHGKNTARSAEGGAACTEHSPRRHRAFFAALCPQRRGHARRLAGAAAARFLHRQPHKSAAETRSLLEAWAAQYACGGFYNWAVVRRADGVLMGAVGSVSAEDAAGGRGAPPGPPGAAARCLFESGGQAAPACCHSHAPPPPAAARCKSTAFALRAAAHTTNTAARPRPAAITC